MATARRMVPGRKKVVGMMQAGAMTTVRPVATARSTRPVSGRKGVVGRMQNGMRVDLRMKTKRWYAHSAPSVRNKIRTDKKQVHETAESLHSGLREDLTGLRLQGLISIHEQDASDFLSYVFDSSSSRTIDRFRQRRAEMTIDDSDLFVIARHFVTGAPKRFRERGKNLLTMLAVSGHETSVLFLMKEALKLLKRYPNILTSKDLAGVREQLTRVADSGHDFRATVLEGKIAFQLRDNDRALAMWTRALEPAVTYAKAVEKRSRDAVHDAFAGNNWDLSTPWNELALFHQQRHLDFRDKRMWDEATKEKALYQKYVDVGCDLDDPVSFFRRAKLSIKVANPDDPENRFEEHTSAWLYNMTKAAVSLHVGAAHELAIFYSGSLWKFIGDEPPDYLKPTPFDSAPPAPGSEPRRTTLDIVKSLLGLGPPLNTFNELSDAMFHTAIFPKTAQERWNLAKMWLEVPLQYRYAPSFLLAANMERGKSLGRDANVPASALNLSEERYADYQLTGEETTSAIQSIWTRFIPTTPLHKWWRSYSSGRSEHGPTTEQVPNRYRNITKAQGYVREIFYAAHAEAARTWLIKTYVYRNHGELRTTDDDQDNNANSNYSAFDPYFKNHHRKWLHQSTVRDMYVERMEQMLNEAKEICDEEGWDLRDDVGALLYKYNRQRHAEHAEVEKERESG